MQCPWKIHWGVGQESTTQCEREEHLSYERIGLAEIRKERWDQHEGRHPNPAAEGGFTAVTWRAGDRREYTGEWPGPCERTPGCILHAGHLRRCAT